MTMPSPRSLAALGLLLTAGVVGVVVDPFGTSSPSGGAAASGPDRGGAQRGAADGTVPDVRLEQLQHDEGPFQAPMRNPFRFEGRTTPAPTGPPRPRRVIEAPPQPIGPPPEPPPPPIPLRYIGYLEPKDGQGRIAVLSDGRGTVIDGKEGDVIEGRYRLLRVGNESADLAYLDGRGRQTIRLSGQ